jgi:hypothetical protein
MGGRVQRRWEGGCEGERGRQVGAESRWSILRRQVPTMHRRILAGMFMLTCSVAGQSQTPPTAMKPNVPEETCTVSGTVLRSADNAPLKNSSVQLILDNDREHAIATRTTVDGQFQLKNVPAGQYSMLVGRNGFVTKKYGQKKPTDPGTKLSLHPGQTVQDLVFHLERAAVITGRVFDEDGEPMIGVSVLALRQTFLKGKKRLSEAGGAQTNDLGEYRIHGLGPGRYYLSAEPIDWEHPVGEKQYAGSEKSGPERAYSKLYYPATADLSRAATVQVKEAEEVTAIDFMMKQITVVRVWGKIVSVVPNGTARTMLDVELIPRNSVEEFNRLTFGGQRVHSDGTFEVPNVPPGEYKLLGLQWGEHMHVTEQDINVGTADIDGVMLVVGPGNEIHGTVVWEGKPSTENEGLILSAASPETEFGAFGQSTVDKESRFLWKDMSEGQFRVEVFGMGKDCYVKEIRVGENLAEGNLIKLGKSSGEVQITISSHGARVGGAVLTTESLPVANAWAVAVAENSWVGKKAWSVTTDQNGHYELRGLPPGKYRVYSWQDLEEGSWEDPEVLKEYEEKGISLELQDGDAKVLDLSLIQSKDGAKQTE